MKVVWICHFSNEQIRKLLPLSNSSKAQIDFAPWITNLIEGFEQVNDVELHIIAPHIGLLKNTFEFSHNNIHYHFFRRGLPFINREWPEFFPVHKWTNFYFYRRIIKKFIAKIQPDIVNLHGAENDYYSISVLDIKHIPVFVTIQGIYSNPERFVNNIKPVKSRIHIERKIHKQKKYFGIFPPFMAELIRRDNPNAIFFRRNYPPDLSVHEIHDVEKKFDFVFFGRVSDVKGVDKIIEALGYLKKQGKNYTLLLIGSTGKEYKEFLDDKIKDLNLTQQVKFAGYLPTLNDVHRKAAEAKVSVISSKFDNIPGSLIESSLIGLPVVATAVGSIPFLNMGEQRILLSPYGDVEGLARNMEYLLENYEWAKQLNKKLQQFIHNHFSREAIVRMFIKQYQAIIDYECFSKPIDKTLLWDEQLFQNFNITNDTGLSNHSTITKS